jgi:hypothetical protein
MPMNSRYKTAQRQRTVGHPAVRSLTFLVCTVVAQAIAASGQVVLTFDDSVLVNDTVFTIGDIARISGSDAVLCKRVAATVAGMSAPPGYARFVSTTEFVAGLLANTFPEISCTLTGAKRPLIRTDYRMARVADY